MDFESYYYLISPGMDAGAGNISDLQTGKDYNSMCCANTDLRCFCFFVELLIFVNFMCFRLNLIFFFTWILRTGFGIR